MGELIPMVVTTGFFVCIGYVVNVIVENRRRRESIKVFTDFYGRVIERLGSANEFTQFLQTPGGRDFIASFSLDRTSVGPRDRILRALQNGLVLMFLGLGFLTANVSFVTDPEAKAVVGVVGLLSLFTGGGFLMSSRLSMRLAQTMGLLVGESRPVA